MEASTVQQQEQLFQKFESYDFESDANFQAWRQLKAATSADQDEPQGSSAPPSTNAAPIINETVAEESQSSSATAADPTYPKSFQEICELIASGKPIPGIRQIPNNLAEGTPSEAKLAPKLKPWEKKKAASAEEPVFESTTPSAEATA